MNQEEIEKSSPFLAPLAIGCPACPKCGGTPYYVTSLYEFKDTGGVICCRNEKCNMRAIGNTYEEAKKRWIKEVEEYKNGNQPE